MHLAMSHALGDAAAGGDPASEDRRKGEGLMSGSSIPRYPYRSACACANARAPDEDDSSDRWTIGGDKAIVSAVRLGVKEVCFFTGTAARQVRGDNAIQGRQPAGERRHGWNGV